MDRRLTGVSLTGTNRIRLTTTQRAILSCSMANAAAMQLRGPKPKAAYAYGFSSDLFSGAQLGGRRSKFCVFLLFFLNGS